MPIVDPALSALLEARLASVEDRLRAAVANTDPLADQTSNHLVAAGGKRLRPLLTLLCSELGTGVDADVEKAAVTVELTHLASLYHDDVMDSAPMRRGAPAAHEVWGNSVAILTGDLLFARASALCAELGPEAVAVQAATFERLCMGQLHETIGPRDGEDPVAHYIQVLADKTASLIATAGRFGTLFGGCDRPTIELVERFGEGVGIAFQLADDVIDLTSDGATTGKTPGTDLREHVPTMPSLLLRARAEGPQATSADREVLALLEGDLTSDAALGEAVAALRAHAVVEQTRDEAVRRAGEAVRELSPLPAGPVKDALVAFADSLVDRVS